MSRYDNVAGKESARANARQSRLEAEHTANNSFVKKNQMEIARMAGKSPNLKPEAQEFNAYMCNNGPHAQEFARDLTKGIDKSAFPVK